MLYVQLDTNWPDHPKLIDAGVEGAGAHAIILCLAKRLEQDGWVSRGLLRRYSIGDDLLGLLARLDLIDAEETRVRPHGWLDRNPSQAAIDAMRAARKDAGKRGNHEKWKHGGDYESCPKCHPEAQVVAGCDPPRSQGDRTPTKSESTTEVTTAIAASDHVGSPVPHEQRELNVAQVAALKQSPFLAAVNPNPAAGAVPVSVSSAALTTGDAS